MIDMTTIFNGLFSNDQKDKTYLKVLLYYA
jgi:hypothetical protein